MENRSESSSLLTPHALPLNDIGNEVSSLRTETGKLFELDPKSGLGQYGLEARTGPVHYKEAYRDSDHWLELDESYCEPGELKGIGRVLVYPRLPNIVTVFQDICGYQIQSRSNPDHVARVELVSIDGLPVTAWQDSAALKTSVRVHPSRVGIWKDFSAASKPRATTMRWRVTELGNADRDSHPFAFRETPEAYNIADLATFDPGVMEQAKVAIETARTRIDDISWYWDEIIPVEAKLVDTDWQVAAGGNDGHMVWRNGTYWEFSKTYNDNIGIGYWQASHSKWGGFYRFTNITIAKNSTIGSAKLILKAVYSKTTSTVKARIRAHKHSNSPEVSDISDYQSRRGTIVGGANNDNITSYVSWSNLGNWTADSWYDTPSIITPMQEIVDLSGWASGNAITWFLDDHVDESTHSNDTMRHVYPYDRLSSGAAKLSVTWTEPTRRGPHIYVPNVSWLSKSLLKRREI